MTETEPITNPASTEKRTRPWLRYAVPVALLLALIVAFFGYRAWDAGRTESAESAANYLSANDLEESYGLGVRLIGVTGGGGMVDFRLKILDSDKARAFLQDPAHWPRLIVAESGEALLGTEELDEDVSWEEGGILFILFSNSDGAIQSGTPVIVEFGKVQLEPIIAQ